jgi:hypothetical protein
VLDDADLDLAVECACSSSRQSTRRSRASMTRATFDSAAPFDGLKDLGIGRELGEAGLDAYLESKAVMIKRHGDAIP